MAPQQSTSVAVAETEIAAAGQGIRHGHQPAVFEQLHPLGLLSLVVIAIGRRENCILESIDCGVGNHLPASGGQLGLQWRILLQQKRHESILPIHRGGLFLKQNRADGGRRHTGTTHLFQQFFLSLHIPRKLFAERQLLRKGSLIALRQGQRSAVVGRGRQRNREQSAGIVLRNGGAVAGH